MLTKNCLLWVAQTPPPDWLFSQIHIGYECEVFSEPALALERLEQAGAGIVLASWPLEGWRPAEFVEQARRTAPHAQVLVHDPTAGAREAFRLGSLGAFWLFAGELEPAPVAERHEEAAAELESADLACLAKVLAPESWRGLLVGESRPMQRVAETIRLVGPRRCTVLITGETGTGKEMAARALHLASPRAHKPLVTVNCGALPEHLLEAELFGHVKGAFTGAIQSRTGRFEQADGGTLFLDEIGDMPLELQVKLLRVLQEREFQRLGSSETVRVDIRVVAASNSDLGDRVRQGRFREDLYYRLNVVPLTMPPLRARLGDVPVLSAHFVGKVCRQESLPVKRLRGETLDRLASYHWPGNVRQLENAVEMAVALSGDRETLYPSDFPLPFQPPSKPMRMASASFTLPEEGLDFDETVGAFERSILEQALRRAGGNKKRAADMLRLKRTTLSAKLRSLEARLPCARAS